MFLTVNRDLYNPSAIPIVQYTHTGIIKGQWHPAMPTLFEAHGIHTDFERRGFFKRKPWIMEKMQTLEKVASDPIRFFRGIQGN